MQRAEERLTIYSEYLFSSISGSVFLDLYLVVCPGLSKDAIRHTVPILGHSIPHTLMLGCKVCACHLGSGGPGKPYQVLMFLAPPLESLLH